MFRRRNYGEKIKMCGEVRFAVFLAQGTQSVEELEELISDLPWELNYAVEKDGRKAAIVVAKVAENKSADELRGSLVERLVEADLEWWSLHDNEWAGDLSAEGANKIKHWLSEQCQPE